MSAQNQQRQPRGVPAGGQFAETARAGASVSLVEEPAVEDLSSRDPVSIDTELAEQLLAFERANQRLEAGWGRIHRAVGDRRRSRDPRAPWQDSDANCRQTLQQRMSGSDDDWQTQRWAELLEEVDAQASAIDSIKTRVEQLETEHERRGWSRFFHVPGGHIHSSRRCSTCRDTTSFTFATHLSGKGEAEAVADLGPVMCTVCFPSAPVEWTQGLPDDRPAPCPGSGNPPGGPVREFGRSQYAECSVCGKSEMVVGYGTSMRKHRTGA